MARNRPNPLDDPPAASSSEEQHHEDDEEEEDEEEVEEEYGEEDDDEPNAQADGSESEEGEDEEEEDDEEDDDKEELKQEKLQLQPYQPKPLFENPKSDDDDEDDATESDSDPTSPGASGFAIKKHVATPAAVTPNSTVSVKPKKSVQKPSIDKDEDPSPELFASKRPAESDLKESKSNAKKVKVNGVGEAKKFAVNRVWTDEDEIEILEGIIKFHEETEGNPTSDPNGFYEIMKGQFSLDVSKSQLMDKVRRLKRKYMNVMKAKGDQVEDPVISRPHDHQCFQLSKKIWGGFLGNQTKKRSSKKKTSVNENAKPKPTTKKENANGELVVYLPKDEPAAAVSNKQQDKGQDGTFSEKYPFLSVSLKRNNFGADLISKEGAEVMEGCLRCLGNSKLDELEAEWKKIFLDEADVHNRRLTLVQKQVQLVSDCFSQRG